MSIVFKYPMPFCLSCSGTNAKFYGRPIDSSDLLSEDQPPPQAAQPLYDALKEVLYGPTSSPNTISSDPPPSEQLTPAAAVVSPTPVPTPTTDEPDRTTDVSD